MIIEAPGETVKPMSQCPDCVLLEAEIRLCQRHSNAAKREIEWMSNWSVTRKSV
jgi:hypothetical protein